MLRRNHKSTEYTSADGWKIREVSGEVLFAPGEKITADKLSGVCDIPEGFIPEGFVRYLSSYSLSKDGNTLTYELLDKQKLHPA